MPTPAERRAAAWDRVRRALVRYGPAVLLGMAAVPSAIRLVGDHDHAWPIMVVSFVPAASLVLVALTALLVGLRRRRSALGGAVLVALNVWWLAPLYGGDDPPDGTDLVAMTINMQYGWADASVIADAVRTRHVDLLGVTELTPEAVSALGVAGLDAALPYRVISPDAAAHGSGLWSRFPLTAAPEWRGVHRMPGAVVHVSDRAGRLRDVDVRVVHPYRTARYNATSYRRDQRMVRERLAAQPADIPAIALGDFNSSRDHQAFRRLLSDGWRDAPEYAGSGFVGTWSARYWMPHFVQLDHILISDEFGARSADTFDVRGTDHAALVARLVLADPV